MTDYQITLLIANLFIMTACLTKTDWKGMLASAMAIIYSIISLIQLIK